MNNEENNNFASNFYNQKNQINNNENNLSPVGQDIDEPKRLRTFEDDIAEAVKDGQGSMARIAIAEQGKKDLNTEIITEQKNNKIFIILGGFFLLGALAMIGFVLINKYKGTPLSMTGEEVVYEHPYLQAEKVTAVKEEEIFSKTGLIQPLTYKVDTGNLTPNSLLVVIPTKTDSSSKTVSIDKNDLFKKIGKHAPDVLVRNIEDTIAVGIYKGDKNQPFILMKTASYENAFTGLLKWESFMSADIFKFFGVELPEQSTLRDVLIETQNQALDTATSTGDLGTSSSSTKSVEIDDIKKEESRNIKNFIDRTIKNKDMRAIQDTDGKIYFVYGFTNRNTIILTTSPETFFEVTNRLKLK